MTKPVIGLDGLETTVPNTTPCHAGKNGALPKLYTVEEAAVLEEHQAMRAATAAIKKADYEANHKYKDDRKKAYGSVEDQLDMLYWDQVNATTIFKDHIAAVKIANPKPVA